MWLLGREFRRFVPAMIGLCLVVWLGGACIVVLGSEAEGRWAVCLPIACVWFPGCVRLRRSGPSLCGVVCSVWCGVCAMGEVVMPALWGRVFYVVCGYATCA